MPMKRDWEGIGRTLQDLTLRCRELGGEPDNAWAKLRVGELARFRAAQSCPETININ